MAASAVATLLTTAQLLHPVLVVGQMRVRMAQGTIPDASLGGVY